MTGMTKNPFEIKLHFSGVVFLLECIYNMLEDFIIGA